MRHCHLAHRSWWHPSGVQASRSVVAREQCPANCGCPVVFSLMTVVVSVRYCQTGCLSFLRVSKRERRLGCGSSPLRRPSRWVATPMAQLRSGRMQCRPRHKSRCPHSQSLALARCCIPHWNRCRHCEALRLLLCRCGRLRPDQLETTRERPQSAQAPVRSPQETLSRPRYVERMITVMW